MADMPAGTVTFLFTDIEGSTRLWDEYPEAMQTALARHDALMRITIERYDGHVFKTIGDAFCAAFHTAPDALNAACAAQQALNAEAWPAPIRIKVRMALHTGAAEIRDNDYFGQPLNRVARLLGTGYGGQILLSLPAEELTRDQLPPSVGLKALGEHLLRDLNRPEQVFQVLHPALPADFPPLKSLNNAMLPNNLPQQLTSFIGREKEITEVIALMANSRLLTLTGSGGGGKTRLALQAAAEMLEQYPDGVFLVELAPLVDPALVVQTAAQALGSREQAGESLEQTLLGSLKSKRLLLVLDNCEHLVSTCAQLAATLLRSCPQVKVLATSREALSISGEQTYRVPSLGLPDPGESHSLNRLSQYEAVRLFIERALLVKGDFAITNQNAPALAQVCHRLDGIPLAIELAAARVRSLTVPDINTRLDNRFRLLTGGDRAALPRQQTLRALVDWSYDLLSAAERLLLARVSIFAGGWSLEAAEQVCAGESAAGAGIEDWEVLDLLTGLVDKSLVLAEEHAGTERFRLLETMRQYATERLLASGEREALRSRHRDWYLALALEAEPHLTEREQVQWLDRLESEHDNFRIALAAGDQAPDAGAGSEESDAKPAAGAVPPGLRLAAALARFWLVRGHLSEGREALERALNQEGAQGRSAERARALRGAGALASSQGDHAAAKPLLEESLSLYRAIGDKRGIACALNNLGDVAIEQGDHETARKLCGESLNLCREIGDARGSSWALVDLGNAAVFQDDYAMARTYFEESLSLYRQRDDKPGSVTALLGLGVAATEQADYMAARTLYEESLSLCRELGDKRNAAYSLLKLGDISLWLGDNETARKVCEESLMLSRKLGDNRAISWSLCNLGNVAYEQGDFTTARTLLEESVSLYREVEDKRSIAIAQGYLGSIALAQGDYAAARRFCRESLITRRESGGENGIAYALEGVAEILLAQDEPLNAARLWAAAAAMRERIAASLVLTYQQKHDRQVDRARNAVGAEPLAAALEEGRGMTVEGATAYALEVVSDLI